MFYSGVCNFVILDFVFWHSAALYPNVISAATTARKYACGLFCLHILNTKINIKHQEQFESLHCDIYDYHRKRCGSSGMYQLESVLWVKELCWPDPSTGDKW